MTVRGQPAPESSLSHPVNETELGSRIHPGGANSPGDSESGTYGVIFSSHRVNGSGLGSGIHRVTVRWQPTPEPSLSHPVNVVPSLTD